MAKTLKDLGQNLFNFLNTPTTKAGRMSQNTQNVRNMVNPRWNPVEQFKATGSLVNQGINAAAAQDRTNTPQRLSSQFLTNFNNFSTLGATSGMGFAPASNLERGAAVAGGITALVNPLNPMNKALVGLDRLGMGAASRFIPQGAPQLVQRFAPHIGGELAQTGGIAALRVAQNREFDPVEDLAFGLGARAAFGAPGLVAQMGKGSIQKALKTIKGQKGAVELPNPFAKGMDLPPAKPTSKILKLKSVHPKEGIYKNPAKIGSETLIEQSGGWKPGLREQFDMALFNKDSKAVKAMLPDVPAEYRAKFSQEIQKLTSTPSLKSILENEQGFVRLGDDGRKIADQKFDTAKFEVTPDQSKTLTRLQKTLGLDTRKVRTFEEMKSMADELGTNPKKLLEDIQNRRITDSEVIALGNQIKTSADRISSLSKQLKRSPQDAVLRGKLDAEEQLLNQAVGKRITGGTEAGRAVVAFKQLANKTLEPAYWLDKAQRQLGVERALKADEIDAINDLIKSKDTLGLAHFISGLGESTMREKMVGLWKAGLLTGVRTHEANIISNTGMGALETIKDIPAAAFDATRSMITGGPRAKAFALDEITSQPSGAIRGLKQGKEYLKSGLDPRDIERAELYRKLRFGDTRGGKVAQKFTDTVFGALGAEDKVFREAAFNRSMMEQLKVAQINGQLDTQIARQVQVDPNGVFDNPIIKQLQERAVQDAAHATFTKENAAASAIAGFRAGGNAGTKLVSDVTMPFVKTPTNVAEALLDYSPAGFVKDVVKRALNAKSVDDRRLAESFGRSTVGSGIVALGYILAQHGMVRGAEEPYNTAANAQDRLEQAPGNSIFIGGEWRKIDRVSPLGNLLILGSEAFKNGGDITKTAFGAVKSLSEQTFLKGLAGGLEAVNNPEQSASNYADSTISSVIPTLMADFARATDSTGNKRDTQDGLTARLMSRLPGWRNELPEKLNPLGEPEPEPNGFLGSLFDPLNSTAPNNDPLVKEFTRVGYDLNYVGKEISKQKLAPNIQREYQRRAGEQVRKATATVIGSPIYKRMNTDQQGAQLRKRSIKQRT